jgi:hypothetical protein
MPNAAKKVQHLSSHAIRVVTCTKMRETWLATKAARANGLNGKLSNIWIWCLFTFTPAGAIKNANPGYSLQDTDLQIYDDDGNAWGDIGNGSDNKDNPSDQVATEAARANSLNGKSSNIWI